MTFFQLSFVDSLIGILISIVLFIGGYQFYFWAQRSTFVKPRKILTFIDSWFGYHPSWVWIYSFLYYIFIILIVLTIKDMRHFTYVVFSYLMLFGMHMPFFLFFPIEVPKEWRLNIKNKNSSEKFLKFIHKYDAPTNCFPSMHISIATLTSLHIIMNVPQLKLLAVAFLVLISLSTMYTKQHYFLDIAPGALFGWIAFKLFQLIY